MKKDMLYYRNIVADEMLRGSRNGIIRNGKLYVAPEVFLLLRDDEVKDVVMGQLKIEDELCFGKVVSVYEAASDFASDDTPLNPLSPTLIPFAQRGLGLGEGKGMGKKMGYAVVTQYPMEGAKGFAMVKFFDKGIMGNELVVAVERIKSSGFDVS